MKCPYCKGKNLYLKATFPKGFCLDRLMEDAFNLINRLQSQLLKEQNKNSKLRNERNHLQTENERLKEILNTDFIIPLENDNTSSLVIVKIDSIKAEAYKEFAEKTNSIIDSLIEKYSIADFKEFKAICQVLRGLKNDTNNLLKEFERKENTTYDD